MTAREIERGRAAEYIPTIVIGGGQAGLSVGYHLQRCGVEFVILDAHERIGDSWRQRWDSLRLFSPARFCSLDGLPFPAHRDAFPTKDEMGDYLEAYASHFELPVRSGMRVERLTRRGARFLVEAGDQRFEADQVVVAIGSFQRPSIPAFASELSPDILQLHSSEYRNPGQLRDGDVLLVGAGNSGSEIAMDLAPHRRVWMSGRHTGHLPFDIESATGRRMVRPVMRGLFHRVLSLGTPVGRRARAKIVSRGEPLIRLKPKQLDAAGVERVPRTVGVEEGAPLLADGRRLDVANVIWCCGYRHGLSWIDLPVFGEDGEPEHVRGVVEREPGLYFVGLEFLYALSSQMIHGVGRDAQYVAQALASRAAAQPALDAAGTVVAATAK